MNKREQNLADLKFIYDSVTRYLEQSPDERIQYFQEHKKDAFYSISNNKQGIIICGRDASEKFCNIASQYFSSEKEKKNKSNLDEFVKKLKDEFLRRYIQNKESIEQTADKMISTAYKSISREFESLIHYIPCAIFSSRTIESFEIGSINFLHKTKFSSTYRDEIEQLRIQIKEQHQDHCALAILDGFPKSEIATANQSQQVADYLVDGVLSSFESYEWVAIVKIPECNKNISYEKAIYVIKIALNILKLLFGSEFTSRIGTIQDHSGNSESAKLTRSENGMLDISLASTPNGNDIGDEWLKVLKTKAAYHFNLAIRVLDVSHKFIEPPPLCIRFVDALSWYGDALSWYGAAISEQSDSAKIIKFVSSIERITVTGKESREDKKERGVTDIVTQRASILYSFATDESFTNSLTKIKNIYKCRSDLLHGSLSPFDDSCASNAHKAEEISRMVLLAGLDYFSSLGIDNFSMNLNKLKLKYNKLEAKYGSSSEPVRG